MRPRNTAAYTNKGPEPNRRWCYRPADAVDARETCRWTDLRPTAGARVERIYNWPGDASDKDGLYEPVGLQNGLLLLGGERPDGSWWYELAYHWDEGPCFATIRGGSFDGGDSVRFSSGLRVPKAPGFNVRSQDRPLDSDMGFPGHQEDSICLDEQGRAASFERFIGL